MAEWKKVQGTPANGGVDNTVYAWKYTITWPASDHAEIKTSSFTFPIRGDFTYIVEEAANIDNEPTSIKVYGSLDNSTWIELDAATTKTVQTAPCANAYDLDAKGRMPFMCIGVDAHASDAHGSDVPSVNVYMVDHLE